MRTIKFRAWDTLDKKMKTSFVIYNENGKAMIEVNGYVETQHDWIVMESTGLIDRNGKEIFEGDIVNCREYKSDSDIEKYFIEDIISFYLFLNEEFSDFSEEPSELEVIGNIYENPELKP